jgi:hypothetical protein
MTTRTPKTEGWYWLKRVAGHRIRVAPLALSCGKRWKFHREKLRHYISPRLRRSARSYRVLASSTR